MASAGFTILDNVLDQYQDSVITLLDVIAAPNPSTEDVSAAASEVVAVDKSLSTALEEVRKHQENHSKILELKKQSQELDAELNNIIQTLAKLREGLVLETKESYWTNQVSFEDLLNYARKLANYSHAPPDYNPERPLETFSHIHAPWPTEEAMRRGRLGLSIGGAKLDATTETATDQQVRSPVYQHNGHSQVEPVPANHAAVFDDMDLFNPDEL